MRAARLQASVADGWYRRVLGGDYPTRAADREVSVADEWRESWRSARERLATSEDPLIGFLRDLGGDVGTAGGRVVDQVLRRVRRTGRDGTAGGGS